MIEFKELKEADISLVKTWLNKKHVKKWYEIPHMNITIDDWMYEISERNDKFQWLTYLIVLWQDQPIGLCQYYRCEDSDERFGTLKLTRSYGIDYLIGEEVYLGKGLGKGIVNLLVETIFSFPDAQRVTADTDKNNKVSQNTLLSCGFLLVDSDQSRYVKEKNNSKIEV